MKIHLHLGAHKTATTFMQRMLGNLHAELHKSNVGYAPIVRVRNEFTRLFNIYEFAGPIIQPFLLPLLRKRFRDLANNSDAWRYFILSDENLAGLLNINYRLPGFYPRIGARVGHLEAVFKGNDTRYFFAVRRYPEYITSSYLQLAVRGRAPDFADYLARFPVGGKGWADAVAALVAVAGPERVTVWTYDWFCEDPLRALRLVAPDVPMEMPEDDLRRVVLPSLTLKGLKILRSARRVLSATEYMRLGKVLRGFEFDTPNPRLEITDPALLADYETKYQADLARIRALGVDLHA